MAFEDDSVFYTFLSTYIILLVLTSAELYHVYRDVTGKHKSRVYILYGLVWINFSMRVVWLFMRRGEWDADYPTLTFVINRFGLIFFFTFCGHVTYIWSLSVSQKEPTARQKLMWGLVYAAVFLFQIVCTILFVHVDDKNEKSFSYDASIVSIALVSVLIGVSYVVHLFYMHRMLRQRMRLLAGGHAPPGYGLKLERQLGNRMKLLIILGCINTACFFLRAVLFLWRPIRHEYLKGDFWYPWGFYYIPEVVPVLMVFVTTPRSICTTTVSRLASATYRQAVKFNFPQEDPQLMMQQY
eukprot:Rmarinus@m.21088